MSSRICTPMRLLPPRLGGLVPIAPMATIGYRVRALREKRGLTQDQLAKKAGITQGTLSLIESDKTETPSGRTMAALCAVLQTTPDFLVAGAGDPDSIDAAIQEHELVFLWRDLPEEGRRLVIDNAYAVKRAFKKEPT